MRRLEPFPINEGTESEAITKRGRAKPSLLEADFPFRELSLVAQADRRATDPVYAGHRWWARRPPGAMRGILLAAFLPETTPQARFWELFRDDNLLPMEGVRVFDPFAGGGTTLVEAARLGATPIGVDVDPLAVEIVRSELAPPDEEALKRAGGLLQSHLLQRAGHLFASTSEGWTPLHFFWLYRVSCPNCRQVSHLYHDLVIARDTSRSGGVIRDAALVAFCPTCLKIHESMDPEEERIDCCGSRLVSESTFRGGRFHCPSCQAKFMHRELRTASLDRVLLAVEETQGGQRRRIRGASDADRALTELAQRFVRVNDAVLEYPRGQFSTPRADPRPISFGISKISEVFTARQLAVFGLAFAWLRDAQYDDATQRALMLTVSNALTTNNRLCGYATDYGRLAPLFSVRSYALPLLSVELNPFHPDSGRGTFKRVLARAVRGLSASTRRYVWNVASATTEPHVYSFTRRACSPRVDCRSAIADLPEDLKFDLCIFDPPYFDYIAYSELSEFYRAWLSHGNLGGAPLSPDKSDKVASFGEGLGRCLSAVQCRLERPLPIAFTYHSSKRAAWDAVGVAMDRAGMVVTALWPLKCDGHMGHHSAQGNCEWDVLVVCRPDAACIRVPCDLSVEDWCHKALPLSVSEADRENMRFAIEMASNRFAFPGTSNDWVGRGR